jgi:hypothetical protein
VQVLNAALAQSRSSERGGVVQCSLAGGRGGVPGSSLDALGAAAHQLIDDMEDQQVGLRVGGCVEGGVGSNNSSACCGHVTRVLHQHSTPASAAIACVCHAAAGCG